MPLSLDPDLLTVLPVNSQGIPQYPPKPPVNDVQTRRATGGVMLMQMLENASHRYPDVDITDYHAPSADGHQVLIRWYAKQNSTPPGSAVLYVHGGGMIIGEIPWFDNILSQLVSLSGVPILSVEYRLAPEVQHPKPVQDVYAALQWLHAHAQELGVENDRIAISGSSAGGGLAAATCLLARKKGGPAIKQQILLYPMLDDRNIAPIPHLDPFITWNHADNETGWNALLGASVRGTDAIDEIAAPGRMVDASGMPPLYLDIGELDYFIGENLEYITKHVQAGVGVEVHIRSGNIHGGETAAPKSGLAGRMMEDRIRVSRNL